MRGASRYFALIRGHGTLRGATTPRKGAALPQPQYLCDHGLDQPVREDVRVPASTPQQRGDAGVRRCGRGDGVGLQQEQRTDG